MRVARIDWTEGSNWLKGLVRVGMNELTHKLLVAWLTPTSCGARPGTESGHVDAIGAHW